MMNTKIQQLEKACKGLNFEIFEDKVLMANAKIGAVHYGLDLSQCAPTFILKVDNQYIALIIQGNKKIDFKKIKKLFGAKSVTMATKEEILMLTGSLIGSVSMINPAIETFIDSGINELDYCYGGCGVEKYTLKIKPADLIKITHATVEDFVKSHDS